MGLLKDMNIFVRSHLSALENDQVAAVRVRWEREKRKSAEDPTPKKGRRKAAVKAPEPVAAPVEAKPARRRRTAAEVAEAEAVAEAEKAADISALELERPILAVEPPEPAITAQSLEERARALFKDLPPAPAEEGQEAPPARPEPLFRRPPPAPPMEPAATASTGAADAATPPPPPTRAPFIPPRPISLAS